MSRLVATCRHCGVEIGQGPSGAWVPTDVDDTRGFCVKKRVGESGMAHEPMPVGLRGAPRQSGPGHSLA